MPKKRTRRIRSPHPGVKLKKRTLANGKASWRAHYYDPDEDRERAVTLKATTAEGRRRWAITKSRQLARIRDDRRAGIEAPQVGPGIDDAIDDYLKQTREHLRPRTAESYTASVGRFKAWVVRQKSIKRTSDLGPAHLGQLREHLERLPRNSKRGGKRRGEKTTKYRSKTSVNAELRAIKTMLGKWRAKGYLPHLSRDDISDRLKAFRVPKQTPEYLKQRELTRLFDAVLVHDAVCFRETRAEHVGPGPRGVTPRHPPMAAFTAFLLLTGCRRNEALTLRWDDLDLDIRDRDGNKAGEIVLRKDNVKTGAGRSITLEVSPALRRLLMTMKLRADGPFVFGSKCRYTEALVQNARERIIDKHEAPAFTWKLLRSTCATYLTNATGIFGAATTFHSAKQLGHSVTVAEKHYLGVHRGISRDARTLEAAMEIEDRVERVIKSLATHAGPVRLASVTAIRR